MIPRPPSSSRTAPLCPYTTLFRSWGLPREGGGPDGPAEGGREGVGPDGPAMGVRTGSRCGPWRAPWLMAACPFWLTRDGLVNGAFVADLDRTPEKTGPNQGPELESGERTIPQCKLKFKRAEKHYAKGRQSG